MKSSDISTGILLFPGASLSFIRPDAAGDDFLGNAARRPGAAHKKPQVCVPGGSLGILHCKTCGAVSDSADGAFPGPENFMAFRGPASFDMAALPSDFYGLWLRLDPEAFQFLSRAAEALTLDEFPSWTGQPGKTALPAENVIPNIQSPPLFSSFYIDWPEPIRTAQWGLAALSLLLWLSWRGAKAVPHSKGAENILPRCSCVHCSGHAGHSGRGEAVHSYPPEQIRIIRSVHDQLVNHLDKRITIEDLARQHLMNPTTLKAMFKSVYGTSLAAHVKEHRMETAARLLSETGDSIARIARAVGYESQSKFTTAFKEFYQTLPTEYRKQHGRP